jgi:hypothetical protein
LAGKLFLGVEMFLSGVVFAGIMSGDCFPGVDCGASPIVDTRPADKLRVCGEGRILLPAGLGAFAITMRDPSMNTDQTMADAGRLSAVGQPSRVKPHRMRPPKRRPSLYQKQIRFMTLFFGAVAVSIAIALLWLINVAFQPIK